MKETIHGHQVLNMICDASEPVARPALEDSVAKRYGDEARFHTCSAENMTLDELIVFLKERGKIRIVEDRLSPGESKACH